MENIIDPKSQENKNPLGENKGERITEILERISTKPRYPVKRRISGDGFSGKILKSYCSKLKDKVILLATKTVHEYNDIAINLEKLSRYMDTTNLINVQNDFLSALEEIQRNLNQIILETRLSKVNAIGNREREENK